MDRTAIAKRLEAYAPAAPQTRAVNGQETWLISPTVSGVYVTEESVLSIGAYYAGVSVLSQDVSSVAFQVVKRATDGSSVVDETNRVHDMVSFEPDPEDGEMSSLAWVASGMWHLNTTGNTYSRIKRDKYLLPIGLELLDPNKVNPKRKTNGRLYYDVDGEGFLPRDILHVAAVGFDGIVGRSPVRQARETLGLAMAVEKFGASYFGNGINPNGIITLPEGLDEVEAEEYRKQINKRHQGPYHAHKYMVLGPGETFTPTSIDAEDAQFLGTRKFQLAEICRILRIPPTKLQDFDKASFSNIEETNQDYYTSSLKPWLKRFQAEFNRKLFTTAERRIWRVDHDVSETLRGRMLDQAQVDKIYREMGVLNADEIRARHGWGRITGGQTYMVPLNSAPLDKVAEASIETLKGVKALDPPKGPSDADGATDGIDTPIVVADGAVNEVNSLRSSLAESALKIVADTSRRMAKREANALRKIARKPDLASLLTALDDFYATEAETLAEALRSSLNHYAEVRGVTIPLEYLTAQLVAETRAELLKAVEGPETSAEILRLADRYEDSRPTDLLTRINASGQS